MKQIPNRLEDGISVTTDIRATWVATMSVVFTSSYSTFHSVIFFSLDEKLTPTFMSFLPSILKRPA